MTYITASDYMQQDFEQRFLERARVFSRLSTVESGVSTLNKRVNTIESRVNDILNITIPNLEARVKVYTDNKISSLQMNLLSDISSRISSFRDNITDFIETEKNKIISRLKDSEDTLKNLITARFPFLEGFVNNLKSRLDRFETMLRGYIPKINLIDGIMDTINKIRTFADCIYSEYITGMATKIKARFDASIDVIKRIPQNTTLALGTIRFKLGELKTTLGRIETSATNFYNDIKGYVDGFNINTINNIESEFLGFAIYNLRTYWVATADILGRGTGGISKAPGSLREIITFYDEVMDWISANANVINLGLGKTIIRLTKDLSANLVSALTQTIAYIIKKIYEKFKDGFDALVRMIRELISKFDAIYSGINNHVSNLSFLGRTGKDSLDDAKFNLSAILPTKCLEIEAPTTGAGGAVVTETKNIALRYTQSVTVDIPTTIDRATLVNTERGDTSLVKFEWTADNSKVTITALGTGTETTRKSTVVKYKDIRGNELVFNITVNPLQTGIPENRSFSATIEVAEDYSTSYSPGSERAPYTITRQADINIAEVKLKPDNTGVYILGKGAGSTSAVVTDNYNNTYHLTINVTPKGGIGKGLVEQTRFYEIGLK